MKIGSERENVVYHAPSHTTSPQARVERERARDSYKEIMFTLSLIGRLVATSCRRNFQRTSDTGKSLDWIDESERVCSGRQMDQNDDHNIMRSVST